MAALPVRLVRSVSVQEPSYLRSWTWPPVSVYAMCLEPSTAQVYPDGLPAASAPFASLVGSSSLHEKPGDAAKRLSTPIVIVGGSLESVW